MLMCSACLYTVDDLVSDGPVILYFAIGRQLRSLNLADHSHRVILDDLFTVTDLGECFFLSSAYLW